MKAGRGKVGEVVAPGDRERRRVPERVARGPREGMVPERRPSMKSLNRLRLRQSPHHLRLN